MKRIFLNILTIFFAIFITKAQTEDSIPSWRQEQLHKIQEYLKNDNILQLANLVNYPLKRINPIPDIETKQAFILYYSTLFDKEFKQKIINTEFTTDNTIDKQYFGLFSGSLWIDNSGKIISINYKSEKEKVLQSTLTKELKSIIHSSVNKWKENILVSESDKFIIRIDLLADHNFRYVSWNKPKSISDKPDLILHNGEQEFQGSMGGVSYKFKNSKWTYIIEQIDMCEVEKDCGLFLKLLLNNEQKLKTRLKEVK